jgi:hypothetical protein
MVTVFQDVISFIKHDDNSENSLMQSGGSSSFVGPTSTEDTSADTVDPLSWSNDDQISGHTFKVEQGTEFFECATCFQMFG